MRKRSAIICATACVFGLTACGSDLGERMEKAALNTLIGMGTVFIVLIIIIGVISLFRTGLQRKTQGMYRRAA